MKYYLIAGEASGDLHGAYLIRALQQQDPTADFRCWGGDLMAEAGADVRKHYRELAFMGFAEVIRNLRTILRNFKTSKADVLTYQPDVLILIDYPGFNLRMAKWAHAQGIRVFYYISPQVWAWKSSRVKQIRAYVERLYVILPFEQAWFAERGVEVEYVGHPLLDVVADLPPVGDFRAQYGLDERPIVALLPGSRKQEIDRMLSVMLAVAQRFPSHQFVVAGAPAQAASYYQSLFVRYGLPSNVSLVENATYPLLRTARAALVTSGTATLETALLNCPEIVCYRGSSISYAIAKRIVKIKYISLVNLIVDQPLVLELIQHDFEANRLEQELQKLLTAAEQSRIKAGYQQLRQQLGGGGAADRTAKSMVQRLHTGATPPTTA
ncbi:MAG: lipid-A-disaccharide synthase [Bacteroidota bacterium]